MARSLTGRSTRRPGLASRRDWDELKHDVKPVYTAVNATAAKAALEDLADNWGKKYGAIIRLWNNAWEEFIPFLDYDVDIRTVLCSTNAIWVFESSRRPRRCFPGGCSARRALTLDAIDAERLSWTRSVGLAA